MVFRYKSWVNVANQLDLIFLVFVRLIVNEMQADQLDQNVCGVLEMLSTWPTLGVAWPKGNATGTVEVHTTCIRIKQL